LLRPLFTEAVFQFKGYLKILVKIFTKIADNGRMQFEKRHGFNLGWAFLLCLVLGNPALAQDVETEEPEALADLTTEQKEQIGEVLDEQQSESIARNEEAALNEDPEAQRRAQLEDEPFLRGLWHGIHIYGSVRLHAINNFNEQKELSEFSLGDGASRIGIRGELPVFKKWWLIGRAESGFDVLDTFTPKAGNEENPEDGLTKRLLYGGIDSENLSATWGKNWSAYYKIAGMADRFSIFGGSAVGVYNAHTDGGPTGTGRADDVLQARIYTNSLKALKIKPFNLNLQFQYDRPIPWVEGRYYGRAYGASAWLESKNDRGIGFAGQMSQIDNEEDPLIKAAGIDGDAKALAMAFRTYGKRWYAALVLARLDNINTTDQNKYVNGRGVELYAQWQFKDKWWLVGGGNWFLPDDDDPEAGQYEVHYYILGLRYTLDSFNRMLYAEYRHDNSVLHDGTPRKSEVTLGFRWDFGHR
jgi:hypothetical protein